MMVSTPVKKKREWYNKFFEADETNNQYKINRARIILSKEKPIQKINEDIFLVHSQSNTGWYKVQWNGKEWICNCPDYQKNGDLESCKHIIALKMMYQQHCNPIGVNGVIEEKKSYSQNWTMYNKAQVQEFELFDKYLYQLVSTIEEPEQHIGRPRLILSDQIFCSVMKVYSQLSSRRAKWLYHEATQRQQIDHPPHFNVVSKALNKEELTPILYELVRLSAKPLVGIEHDFAVDSSGFRCSSFGNYCEEKHKTKHWRNWLKVHISTGVNTNIVADVVITDEHAGDSPQFKELIHNTSKHFKINEISADMAYSSRKNLDLVGRYGGKAYIPFRKGATGTSKGSRLWNKTYHYFQLNKEEFMEHYHKRSNVESTFAAIKKKFGETLKSRNRTAQVNEMLCKIIAYNITVLIKELIKNNLSYDLFDFETN